MTAAQMQDLEGKVLQIFAAAREPLSIPKIEKELAGPTYADTFDARDAVWRLVGDRRPGFTPRRQVKTARW